MNLVLIGYRGCGKSTIGRLLAEELWMKFVDIDEQIAVQTRRPVAEVFLLMGEAEFSRIESYVIAHVSERDGQVISVGGRALMRPENVQSLKSGGRGRLVWLKAEAEILARRLAERPRSPNFTDTLEEIRALLAQREPVYAAAADVCIDTSYMTADRTVKEIARLI